MPESGEVVPGEEDTSARTGTTGGPTSDARLERLLHDLDVANDAHPADRRPTAHSDTSDEHRDEQRQDDPAAE